MIAIQKLEDQLLNDSLWITTMEYIHRGKDIKQGIREAFGHLVADEERLKNATLSDCKKLVNSWISNKRFPRENVIKKRKDLSNL